jgi:hypothetical protein
MPFEHRIYNHSHTITEIWRFLNDIRILCFAHSIVHFRTRKPAIHKNIKPSTIYSVKGMIITSAERPLLAVSRSQGNAYERPLWRNKGYKRFGGNGLSESKSQRQITIQYSLQHRRQRVDIKKRPHSSNFGERF